MSLLSMTLLPQNRRRHLPLHIQQLIDNVQKYQQLSRWLTGSDLDSWMGLVPLIRSIFIHRPSGWLCAMFDVEVLIWPMSKRDTSIAIVSIKNFRHRLQSKLRQPIPIAMNHNYVLRSFDKEVDWSSEYLQWRDDRMNLEQR